MTRARKAPSPPKPATLPGSAPLKCCDEIEHARIGLLRARGYAPSADCIDAIDALATALTALRKTVVKAALP